MRYLTTYVLAAGLILGLTLSGCASPTPVNPPPTTEAQADAASIPVDAFSLQKSTFSKSLKFPGELSPYETVDVYPKVEGFIQQVYVDRGSHVHQGQLLASLVAPELEAKIAEALSKVKEAEAADSEAQAKYLANKGVYDRLHEASKVQGVISENELANAKMAVQAAAAHVESLKGARMAALANVHSLQEIKGYLQIRSPIEGIITERDLHPGALVGPSGAGADQPIVKIQQISHLRLLVSIPERYYGGIKLGSHVPFTVSAYPARAFQGVISRPAYAVNEKNRTETVEIDVSNQDAALSPGMYAEVQWPVQRQGSTFMVPTSAVVFTTERTFVERIRDAKVEWVNVHKGFTDEDRIEIFGDLQPGDQLVLKGSDEYREGSKLSPHLVANQK